MSNPHIGWLEQAYSQGTAQGFRIENRPLMFTLTLHSFTFKSHASFFPWEKDYIFKHEIRQSQSFPSHDRLEKLESNSHALVVCAMTRGHPLTRYNINIVFRVLRPQFANYLTSHNPVFYTQATHCFSLWLAQLHKINSQPTLIIFPQYSYTMRKIP